MPDKDKLSERDKGAVMSYIPLKQVESGVKGYTILCRLYDEITSCREKEHYIEILKWFDGNMCAPLGCLLTQLYHQGHKFYVKSDSKIREFFEKNGFNKIFGESERSVDCYNTVIPYEIFSPTDSLGFSEYAKQWLPINKFPDMTERLWDKIQDSIFELFSNAAIHSETEKVYICGQFFPKKKRLTFSMADSGIGFQKRIYRSLNKKMPAAQAISWATQCGTTTKTDVPGGHGLDLLKKFISYK